MVPTPVGNVGDMTPRAIEVLRAVSLILAEDTRTSGLLLKRLEVETPMRSHHKFNEHGTVDGIISLLQAGSDIALITDAGTPGISDPGFLLARECRRHGITVDTLPGATALIPALVNSGLPCERFTFEGFLPQKKGRQSRLDELRDEPRTMIFYESPVRLARTLQQMGEAWGAEREASVSREISKLHGTTVNGTLAELHDYFTQNEPRGEIVIVVAGRPAAASVKVDKYAQFKQKHAPQGTAIN